MKTLISIVSLLLTILTGSAQAQITFDAFPWPPSPTISFSTNASLVHVCGTDTSNHSVLLTGNGSNSGQIEIALSSPINNISLDAATNQPGLSGKVEIQGYDANHNAVGNAVNYDGINVAGCPTFPISHTFSGAVYFVRIQKHTGSSADLIIDNINSTTPLPVELVAFSGYSTTDKVNLQWKTATEINNYGFEIQKKIDLNEWEAVGFVKGHGTSNTYQAYSFSDRMGRIPFSEIRYRLRQINRDGTFTYSNELVFSSNHSIIENLAIYPNPASQNKTATVSFNLTIPKYVSIDLYDMRGKRIKVVVDNEYLPEGIHFRSIDMSNLASGMYTVRLRYEGSSHSGRILIR